jgi:hypothetical protein
LNGSNLACQPSTSYCRSNLFPPHKYGLMPLMTELGEHEFRREHKESFHPWDTGNSCQTRRFRNLCREASPLSPGEWLGGHGILPGNGSFPTPTRLLGRSQNSLCCHSLKGSLGSTHFRLFLARIHPSIPETDPGLQYSCFDHAI